MEEKKKVVKPGYPYVWKKNSPIFHEDMWWVKFKSGQKIGPYFKAHKFEGCDLVAVYDEDNEDANLYDANGNIIYNDIHEKYDILLDDVKNVLRIGKDTDLIESEDMQKNILCIPAVQSAIFKILRTEYKDRIEDAVKKGNNCLIMILQKQVKGKENTLKSCFSTIVNMKNDEQKKDLLKC